MPSKNYILHNRIVALCCLTGGLGQHSPLVRAEGAGFDEEILVVAPTPAGVGLGIRPERLPFTTQSGDSDALERAQSLDLTDYLNSSLGSVSINSAQNNPRKLAFSHLHHIHPGRQFEAFVTDHHRIDAHATAVDQAVAFTA